MSGKGFSVISGMYLFILIWIDVVSPMFDLDQILALFWLDMVIDSHGSAGKIISALFFLSDYVRVLS